MDWRKKCLLHRIRMQQMNEPTEQTHTGQGMALTTQNLVVAIYIIQLCTFTHPCKIRFTSLQLRSSNTAVDFTFLKNIIVPKGITRSFRFYWRRVLWHLPPSVVFIFNLSTNKMVGRLVHVSFCKPLMHVVLQVGSTWMSMALVIWILAWPTQEKEKKLN